MEADWSVALAESDPIISVPWAASAGDVHQSRFIDLRQGLDLIDEIEEARATPHLRSALLLFNGPSSLFWTAKCDVWNRRANEEDAMLDPYEMEAAPGQTVFGAGSYIDLFPRDATLLLSFERQERWMRLVVARLRAASARAARAELVMRPALVEDVSGFGVTWFVEGCGATAEFAEQSWSKALAVALPVIMEARP